MMTALEVTAWLICLLALPFSIYYYSYPRFRRRRSTFSRLSGPELADRIARIGDKHRIDPPIHGFRPAQPVAEVTSFPQSFEQLTFNDSSPRVGTVPPGADLVRERPTPGSIVVEIATITYHNLHHVEEAIRTFGDLLKEDDDFTSPQLDKVLQRGVGLFHWTTDHLDPRVKDFVGGIPAVKQVIGEVHRFDAVHSGAADPHLIPHEMDDVAPVEWSIPAAPLILITLRHSMALLERKTTIERALKHAAMQAGTVALLGNAGATVGYAVGFAVGHGPGAIVGSKLGKMIFVRVGNLVVGYVIRRPFNRAVEQYRSASQAWIESTAKYSKDAAVKRNQFREAFKREHNEDLHKFERELTSRLKAFASDQSATLQQFNQDFHQSLDDGHKRLSRNRDRYLRALCPSPWERIAGRTRNKQIAIKHVNRIFATAAANLGAVKSEFDCQPAGESWRWVGRWASGLNIRIPTLSHAIGSAESQLSKIDRSRSQFIENQAKAVHLKVSVFRWRLNAAFAQIDNELHHRLDPLESQMRTARAKVLQEGKSLGLKCSG